MHRPRGIDLAHTTEGADHIGAGIAPDGIPGPHGIVLGPGHAHARKDHQPRETRSPDCEAHDLLLDFPRHSPKAKTPLPRFEAGEGGDPRRSRGEGEGRARAVLELPSPPIASRWVPLSRFKARERENKKGPKVNGRAGGSGAAVASRP